jgi:cytochrome c oxidase assembly protein subunit 11
MNVAMERNNRTAMMAAILGLAMLGLAFASVPLYRLFCQVTGYGGTTQVAEAAPGAIAGEVGVRFDSNISPALPWEFEPVQERVRVAPGARTQVSYRATNVAGTSTTGRAVFNVSPASAGQYFSKIECFCFTEQTLAGGQTVDMPVVFFVDPEIRRDPNTRNIDEITLSYTFYPVETGRAGS